MFLPASTAPIRAAVPHMWREEGDCPCFRRKQDRLLQLTSVWDDGTCSTSHAGCTECSCSTRCRCWSSRSYNADSLVSSTGFLFDNGFCTRWLSSLSTVSISLPRRISPRCSHPRPTFLDDVTWGPRTAARLLYRKLSRSDMGLAASALLARQSGTVCRANWGTKKLHCRCLDGNWRHFYFCRRSHSANETWLIRAL